MKAKITLLILFVLLCGLISAAATPDELFQEALDCRIQDKYEPLFRKLATDYSDTLYGQKALLEVAKIHLLDRHYPEAIAALEKIYLPEIEDKQFWMAKAYLKNEQYQLAIVSSQIYISDTKNLPNAEVAYFLMAEAYLQKRQYSKAKETLEELHVSKYIHNNIPLLYYKLGNCCELLSDFNGALAFYRKLKQEYPYHQYSYMAEERIYALKNEDKINVDLSTFTSYRPTEKQPESKAATGEDMKIYLQVGAFGSNENAEKMGKKIKNLGYKYSVFTKISNNKKLYIVVAGPFDNEVKLSKALEKLENNGMKSFVVKRYD